jgi:hypothetical protein
MFLVLTNEDCARLRPDVLREILAQVGLTSASATYVAPTVPKGAEAMNFAGIVDLTSEQVYEFMSGLGKKETRDGLRVFAEHGPIVEARLLAIPNNNYSHFQTDLTKRIRGITGNSDAALLTWDPDWKKRARGTWRYAATVVTHQSLRKYFGLDGGA